MGICFSREPPAQPGKAPHHSSKNRSTHASDTASIASTTPSITTPRPRADSFTYDNNGRRLHADFVPLSEPSRSEKVYMLPNDDEEMDRLHLQHYMIRMLYQSNFSAPVGAILGREGARCLDLGCGSGIWVMEMATDYPQCHFTGLDITPVQPSTVKPRNVDFMEGDLTRLPLPFEDATFDFVYMRLLILGLKKDYWPVLINELVRITKPGGWIELMEPSSDAMPGPTKYPNLMEFVVQGIQARGADVDIHKHLEPLMKTQPLLTNVRTSHRALLTCPDPSNRDSVRLAKLWCDDLALALTGLKAPCIARGICAEEDWDEILRGHVAETRARKDYALHWTRCYGRRRWDREE
ncbi:hypothetical protein HDV00_004543 [Rhizophlyctis rosea]|nr:hypothetical protein HDV00_004543 [Rhizophlyctis rosea]